MDRYERVADIITIIINSTKKYEIICLCSNYSRLFVGFFFLLLLLLVGWLHCNTRTITNQTECVANVHKLLNVLRTAEVVVFSKDFKEINAKL